MEFGANQSVSRKTPIALGRIEKKLLSRIIILVPPLFYCHLFDMNNFLLSSKNVSRVTRFFVSHRSIFFSYEIKDEFSVVALQIRYVQEAIRE